MRRLALAVLLLAQPAWGQLIDAEGRAGVATRESVIQANGSLAAPGSVTLSSTLYGKSTLGVDISGIWTGQLEFELTVDGTAWEAHDCQRASTGAFVNATASNGIFICQVAGSRAVRVRASALSAGSAVITMRSTLGTHIVNVAPGDAAIGTVGVTGNVAITAAALPLPAGAATSALQDGIIKDGAGDTTQANVSSGRVHVDGSGVTQPVSGTVSVSEPVTVDGTVAVSGTVTVDGSGVTQPISAAALPLPAGASTAALQDGIIKDGAGDTTQANVSSGRVHVDGSGVTQPISATDLDVQIGGSDTVTVTATNLDVRDLTHVSDSVKVGDGTDTALVSAGGSLQVTCDNCGGSTFADDDAFTGGTTPVVNIGALYDTTPPAISDGSAGAPRMNSSRALLVDGSGVTQPISGTVTANAGTGTLDVSINQTGANNAVDVLTMPTVTVTDGLDVDTTSADQITPLGTAADGAAVSGNPLRVGGKDGSGNTQDIITDAAGELQVDVLTLPSVTIGTFPDNEPINVAQKGGSTVVAGPCEREVNLFAIIDQTAGEQLITGTASERIYICSFHVVSTSGSVALVSGTGTVCATSLGAMIGGTTAATGWPFASNGGLVLGWSPMSWAKTDTDADNVCLLQSGGAQTTGSLTYVSIPNI